MGIDLITEILTYESNTDGAVERVFWEALRVATGSDESIFTGSVDVDVDVLKKNIGTILLCTTVLMATARLADAVDKLDLSRTEPL